LPSTAQKCSKRERVAILLAEGDLSDTKIAEEVGVSRRAIVNWKNDPEFRALQDTAHQKIVAAAYALPIARKEKRLKVLDDLYARHVHALELRAQRIADELSAVDTPEGATRKFFGNFIPAEAVTGLFVKKETTLANGMKSVEWVYDGSIFKAICDLQKQAGLEVGNFSEGQTDTKNINITVMARQVVEEFGADFDPDEVIAETNRLLALASGNS